MPGLKGDQPVPLVLLVQRIGKQACDIAFVLHQQLEHRVACVFDLNGPGLNSFGQDA